MVSRSPSGMRLPEGGGPVPLDHSHGGGSGGTSSFSPPSGVVEQDEPLPRRARRRAGPHRSQPLLCSDEVLGSSQGADLGGATPLLLPRGPRMGLVGRSLGRRSHALHTDLDGDTMVSCEAVLVQPLLGELDGRPGTAPLEGDKSEPHSRQAERPGSAGGRQYLSKFHRDVPAFKGITPRRISTGHAARPLTQTETPAASARLTRSKDPLEERATLPGPSASRRDFEPLIPAKRARKDLALAAAEDKVKALGALRRDA